MQKDSGLPSITTSKDGNNIYRGQYIKILLKIIEHSNAKKSLLKEETKENEITIKLVSIYISRDEEEQVHLQGFISKESNIF